MNRNRKTFATGSWLFVIGATALLNGCSSDDAVVVYPAGSLSPAEQPQLGSARLPLVTTSPGQFRLRNAVFDISTRSGALAVSLDSESNPDAEALVVPLAQGAYDVLLRDGWTLEAVGDGGFTPVSGALISVNPVPLAIRNDRVSEVVYTFTTESATITFGEGELSVSAAVADPASLPSCDIVNQVGCQPGQTCLLSDDTGDTFCATPGSLPVGASCSSQQCVYGAQCLDLDGEGPLGNTCSQFCNPLFPSFGCDCKGISVDEEIGVCGPPPAGTCDLLGQTGCGEGQACQLPAGASFGVCGSPGAGAWNESCIGEVCQTGFDCYGDQPEFGYYGSCLPFCDIYAPSCAGCFDVGTGRVGRCFY